MSDTRPPDRHDDRELGQGVEHPMVSDSERDINSKWLLSIGAAIVIAAVVVFIGVAFALNYMTRPATEVDVQSGLNPRPTVPAVAPTVPLPPEPRLQVYEPAELEAIRSEWDAQLTTYGWANPERTRVHIPIEQAKQIVLQRGLPVIGEPQGATLTDDDSEVLDSSSGRIFEEER